MHHTYFQLHIRCSEGRLLVVQKDHIKSIADITVSLDQKYVQGLLSLINQVDRWDEFHVQDCKRTVFEAIVSPSAWLNGDPERFNLLSEAFQLVKSIPRPPIQETPGSIIKQRMVVQALEEEVASSPVTLAGEQELVLRALRYAASQKDPVAFVENLSKPSATGNSTEVFAWRMFQNVLGVLRSFGALNGTRATTLGQTVGSLSADNELWLALVLQSESLKNLTAAVSITLRRQISFIILITSIDRRSSLL